MVAWAKPLVKGVNSGFSNQCKITGLLDNWIMQDKLYWRVLSCVVFFFLSFFSVLFILSQLFGRMLQVCFAVKLQPCFANYKCSYNFPLPWGWADDDWIFWFLRDFLQIFKIKCQHLKERLDQNIFTFPCIKMWHKPHFFPTAKNYSLNWIVPFSLLAVPKIVHPLYHVVVCVWLAIFFPAAPLKPTFFAGLCAQLWLSF